MWQAFKILLIDDNTDRRNRCQQLLEFIGEQCEILATEKWQPEKNDLQEYLAIILGNPFDKHYDQFNQEQKILLDVLRSRNHQVPVILLTEKSGSVDEQVETVLLAKMAWPFSYIDILGLLHRCQIARSNCHALYKGAATQGPNQLLIGNSTCIKQVRQLISQVADSEATVLITGESGTGKEVVARQIHQQSKRAQGPFVPVNCGAIPAELLESELFGHEKGAFTGAISARQGRFELAKGGTLFLDEIGDMPLAMQVKLLRVIQERTFERVGCSRSTEADVRIVTATNRNLEHEIEEGNFREDLYYRINVFPIEIPRLKERAEDIPDLIHEFVSKTSAQKGLIRFMPDAIVSLQTYHWPGNIRELSNLIERLIILYPNGIIDKNDLPDKFNHSKNKLPQPTEQQMLFEDTLALPKSGLDLKQTLHDMELNYIRQALGEANGVVAHAADILKMRRTTLVEKMRKFGLSRPETTPNL